MEIVITVAQEQHQKYADAIVELLAESAAQRGTGIARRSPEYIVKKMSEGKAIIALDGESLVGFCYIETWGHEKYVANSGLIVHSDYRGKGVAKQIKKQAFALSRKKYPEAKIFGITTSLATMKINSDLGYVPVTFSELTTDEDFWKGCQTCKNIDILTRTERSHCLCTGMLFDANRKKAAPVIEEKTDRWSRFRQFLKNRQERLGIKINKTVSTVKIFI